MHPPSGAAERAVRSHGAHFKRDEIQPEATGHLARELPIRMLPPRGGNPTEGENNGSQKESDEEAEKGQVYPAYQATLDRGQRDAEVKLRGDLGRLAIVQ